MSIVIDKDKCVGCRKCIDVCPGSLIKTDENNRAYIKYPKNCWGCTSCVKECSRQAIAYYLGADIGGMGTKLTTRLDGDIVHWDFVSWNGKTETIDINRKDANKY